jgi:DNA-binding XRE family transcriptional regulator
MRIKLEYGVKNELDAFINREVGKRMMQGVNVLKKDVMEDLADFCGIGFENIKRIKKNASQPSLAVALKIAEYFEVKVEDIFKIY